MFRKHPMSGKSTKFYNQSFVQQWIAEAEKGEQGAV
jgi:hypothetical protein